jgi:hypothetical protein
VKREYPDAPAARRKFQKSSVEFLRCITSGGPKVSSKSLVLYGVVPFTLLLLTIGFLPSDRINIRLLAFEICSSAVFRPTVLYFIVPAFIVLLLRSATVWQRNHSQYFFSANPFESSRLTAQLLLSSISLPIALCATRISSVRDRLPACGDSICSNRIRVKRDFLETKLLSGLQEKVLREDVVNYTLDRFEQQLEKELLNIGGEMDRMKKRKEQLEIETARLADGLARGLYSVTVMAEISRREREISEISDRLLSSKPDSVRSRIKKLRDVVLSRMQDLRQYLTGGAATARAWLTKHVDKIVMQPDGGIYVASGKWDLLGSGRGDGAEGAVCSLLPHLRGVIPFEGLLRSAA